MATAPALELVISEGQARMVIVVEGAEAFVALDPESKSLRDPLDGKVAKLLQFILFHNCQLSIVNCEDIPLSSNTAPSGSSR